MKITMTALSPIVHGEYSDGADIGNMMQFRRIPIQHNGRVYNVPVLSGNSTRGNIRRLIIRELVDRFGLRDAMGKYFDKFYVAAANGGNLDKSMDVAVDTNRLREIRKLLPPLSVFGSALYKYMLSGVVNIGFAVPRCKELGTGDNDLISLTADIGLTRHLDKEVADPQEAKPMPYTVETVITGSVFDLDITFAPHATPVEIACIAHGLNLMSTVGGKSGSGFGRVDIDPQDDSEYMSWLESITEDDIGNIVKFAAEL